MVLLLQCIDSFYGGVRRRRPKAFYMSQVVAALLLVTVLQGGFVDFESRKIAAASEISTKAPIQEKSVIEKGDKEPLIKEKDGDLPQDSLSSSLPETSLPLFSDELLHQEEVTPPLPLSSPPPPEPILVPPSGEVDPIPYQRVLSALPPGSSEEQLQAVLPFENKHCSMTAQIQITRLEDDRFWLLTTFGQDGSPKQVGGDDYYVFFYEDGQPRNNPLAIANITDLHNGTYHLTFHASPTAPCDRYDNLTTTSKNSNTSVVVGTLEVILEQTCGVGNLPPPIKQDWVVSGAVNQFYVIPNITAPRHIQPFRATQCQWEDRFFKLYPSGRTGRFPFGSICLCGK